MHPAEKDSLKRIGLIAGTGRLPEMLLSNWERLGFTPHVVVLDGITDPNLAAGYPHVFLPIGAAGAIIEYFKTNHVVDIVLAGSLAKPEWSQMRPDARGMKIILKVAMMALGDDALLKVIRRELEQEGLVLHGVQEYIPEILAGEGVMTRVSPLADDASTIDLGLRAAKELGRQDKGQSVVVQQDLVLGLEGRDGTKKLMEMVRETKSSGRGPILVKVSKPQQDRALDMPTIGIQTIETAHECGFAGIVVEAGETLILDKDQVIGRANEYGLFLIGMNGGA